MAVIFVQNLNSVLSIQEPKTPIAAIPLAGNEVIRHPPEPGEPGKFKFEIICE